MRLMLIAAGVLAWPGAALAEFHPGMSCGECHSRASSDVAVGAIRPDDDVALCLRCHDGRLNVPDVVNDAPRAPGATGLGFVTRRSAGRFSLTGSTGATHSEWSGHTLGSTAPPPGFIGAWPPGARLTCKSCHAVHPNGNYRNLGPDPIVRNPAYGQIARLYPAEALPSYEVVGRSEAREGADVFVMRGESAYDDTSVVFATNDGRNAMNEFCATCHGAFHGPQHTEDASTWQGKTRYVRHPTSGVAIGPEMRARIAESAEPLRLSWRADGTAEVACLSCHRAHGTTNPFALVYWDPRSIDNGENGASGQMESLCRTCHQVDGDDSSVVARSRYGQLPPE